MRADADAYLAARIQEALARDPRTHKLDVDVTVDGTTIRLEGQTSTEDRRETVAVVVAELCPTREVRNHLVVIDVTGPGAPEVIHD